MRDEDENSNKRGSYLLVVSEFWRVLGDVSAVRHGRATLSQSVT